MKNADLLHRESSVNDNSQLIFLEKVLSETDYKKGEFFREWLKSPGNTLSFENLKVALGYFSNHQKAADFASQWFVVSGSASEDHFVELVKAGFFSDPTSILKNKAIAENFISCLLPLTSFPSICRKMYPTEEVLQVELFKNFVEKQEGRRFDKWSKDAFEVVLKDFVSPLGADSALQTVRFIPHRFKSKKLTLEIVGGRFDSKYESLKSPLGQCKIDQSLTEDGLRFAKDLFKNEEMVEEDDLQSITVADLFSYCAVMHNNFLEFRSLLNSETLQVIERSYSPPAAQIYFTEDEVSKLSSLIGDSHYLGLFPVSELTGYLKAKIPETKKLSSDEILQYQFGESEFLGEITHRESNDFVEQSQETFRDKITSKFRILMTERPPKANQIAEFFAELLGSSSELNVDKKNKLHQMFVHNKDELACLFSQKNGLDFFVNAVHGIGDGCASNLATAAKIALHQLLIADLYDQQLYAIFIEKISTPILNFEKNRLGERAGPALNIFESEDINSHFINAGRFVKVLEEEFYKSEWDSRKGNVKKIGKDAWKIIGSAMSDYDKECLMEVLLESANDDQEKFNEEAAKIAAYIILQKTLPRVLESRHLKEFKDSCETWIGGIRESKEMDKMGAEDKLSLKVRSDAKEKSESSFVKKLKESISKKPELPPVKISFRTKKVDAKTNRAPNTFGSEPFSDTTLGSNSILTRSHPSRYTSKLASCQHGDVVSLSSTHAGKVSALKKGKVSKSEVSRGGGGK